MKKQAEKQLLKFENKQKRRTDFVKFFFTLHEKHRLFRGETTEDKILNCGTYLEFLSDTTKEKYRLVSANFCEQRMCPVCAMRKSKKELVAIKCMTDYLYSKGYRFLFLTLTVPNVPGDKLKAEIEDFNKSFQRLVQSKAFKKLSHGYISKLEITYNTKSDTYHPHFHVLIAVKENYFQNPYVYLSHAKWLSLWQRSKRDESIQFVNIKAIKTAENILKPTLEISKYIAKDSDYLVNQKVFETFYFAIKNKKFLKFAGLYKEARQDFKKGRLDEFLPKDDAEWQYLVKAQYNYSRTKYDEEWEDLSPEEIKNYIREYKMDVHNVEDD